MPALIEEGPGTPYICYGSSLIFIRQCPECALYVRADHSCEVNGFGEVRDNEPNATCKRHGRVQMPFVGHY